MEGKTKKTENGREYILVKKKKKCVVDDHKLLTFGQWSDLPIVFPLSECGNFILILNLILILKLSLKKNLKDVHIRIISVF